MKKVSIVGLGYIGIPTSVIVAQSGYSVSGFDIDKKKITSINAGDPTIFEPEIKVNLKKVLKKGTFKANAKIQAADVFIIAVPTPFKDKKIAELSYVYSACKSVASVLKKGNLIILESTVPVGTTRKLKVLIEAESGLACSKDFFLAYCPERVLPGRIFKELVFNDRIIGGICNQSSELAKIFYKAFVKGNLYIVNDKTAEMVKLVENSSRDVQIAFANQVSSMCKEYKINPYEVVDLANKHPRVNILNPGCGVGGHCIAVDPWFLIKNDKSSSLDSRVLLKSARRINDRVPNSIIREIRAEIKKKPNSKVLLLGLAFKADVDDFRNSPALKIAKSLNKKNLYVCEPYASSKMIEDFGFKNPIGFKDGLKIADIIVCLVGHQCFKDLSCKDLSLQASKTRLVLKRQVLKKLVLDYCGITYISKISQKPRSFIGAVITDEVMNDSLEPDNDSLLVP